MKEIQTNGITILFVEVPEDAKEFDISDMGSLIYYVEWGNSGYIDLPQGQYQILGKSTELSEEQMKEICWQVSFGNYTGYKNYNQAKCSDFRDIVESSFSTVQESYISLLEANGIVDRFSISEPPENIGSNIPEWEKEYQKEKSKVKNYLVLKRI